MEIPSGDTGCSEGPRRRGTPRGAGWESQRGTGSGQADWVGERRAEDLVRREKSGRQDARSGRRSPRTWSDVRGHSEVTGISTRGQGAGLWGCLGSSPGGRGGRGAGRAGSWRGGHRAPGCVPSGRPEPQGPGRPRPGAWRSPQTRGCEGPRGVSELGSRGAQTPPHCEPRLRGGGRPGPPSASHRRRRRLPGLPGPRNAVAVAGGAVPGEGEGAIAAGPVSPPQPSFPDGAPCWGIRWQQARAVGSLNPSLPRPVARAPPHEAACFSNPDTAFGFPILVSLLPTPVRTRTSLLISLGLSLPLSNGVVAVAPHSWSGELVYGKDSHLWPPPTQGPGHLQGFLSPMAGEPKRGTYT